MAFNGGLNIAGQFGMPLYGISGLPPFTGNFFWVNATTGSDGNTGGPQDPFATITQALLKTTNNNNDVIFLTGTYHTTATIAWTNNFTHLIGLAAPSNNGRARISATGATPFSPLVHNTGEGCIFQNLGTFHGGFTSATGSQVCWADGGGRNHYKNVQFFGGGDLTTAALTGMRSLTLGGDGENLIEDCTIGLDTIVRATNANASLEIIGGSPRNIIRRTMFQADVSDASDTHVLIASGGMDRYLLLDGCTFQNFGTTMNAAISNAGGSPGGNVIVTPTCISIGATAISASGNVYIGQISAAGATTTSVGLLAS